MAVTSRRARSPPQLARGEPEAVNQLCKDGLYRLAYKPSVLVHASRPRALYKMFPQSIEVQMKAGDAGDFWVIQEDIEVPDMVARRPKKTPDQKYGGTEADARQIRNLTDTSEKPLGEWNNMVVEARGDTLKVWVNGDLVNEGSKATATSGKLALQAEGTEVEFRKVEIGPLPKVKPAKKMAAATP